MARSCPIVILMKLSSKGLELVASLQHWAKNMFEMFVIQHSYFLPGLEPPPPPFSEGTTPFWLPSSFWCKFKKLTPSFWEPSKLVHANCKKHFKMKVLCFVLYQVKWEHHWHCTLYLLLYLLLTLSLVTYCL